MMSPEIQSIIDQLKKLPEDDPLSIFIKKISDRSIGLQTLTGNIRSQVSTAISLGGLDPKNAEKYVLTLLAAANRTKDFASVWKSVSGDLKNVSVATTASFDKLDQAVKKTGESFFTIKEYFYEDPITGQQIKSVETYAKKYDDLNSEQQAFADQMLNILGLLTSGSLTFDQINRQIEALDKSSIDSATSITALSAAILESGNPDAIARVEGLNKIIEDAGKKGKISTGEFLMMNLALEMLARQGKNLGDVGVKLFGAGAQSVSDAFVNLAAAASPSYMKDFYDTFAKEQKRLKKLLTNSYKDPEDGVDGLSKASEAYLKVLDAEIKGLEAKRDAQKNVNDESQRQIDLQMKMKGLANEAVLAKISGDYIKAASLQQQAQNVQMEFNQETELRKKDAEIARLKAREAAIKGGDSITKAEAAKIPKDPKAKKKASGGMIRGAGTGTSDSIPALLSNGEYVVKAKSVKKYGVGALDALNAGRFADGGLATRPKYGTRPEEKKNWFQRYVEKLTKSQKEGAAILPSFMTSNRKADALGAGSILRKITGQGEEGDTLNAILFPLNFMGMGSAVRSTIAKPAVAGAAKSPGILSRLYNLRSTRKAEALLKQKQIADDLARFKANPPPRPPARPGSGAPGAPSAAAPKSMFDPDFDFESLVVSGATPGAATMSKPSIFSKISDSSIVKKVKTLSRVASTPAYHLKAMVASAKRAWQHGPSSTRWQGSFDRVGRFQLADEAISRLFGGIALKANPILRIAQKTKDAPNVLPEGATIFDPLNFFEKLLLDTKRPGDFYKATYKNIIPNIRKNYVGPAAEGLRGATVSGLYKMAGITQTSASKLASKAVPIKDISAAVMKSFSYKMKTAIKDKYRSFLNIFKTTKVGKPFDNAPIDYRTLLMTGQKANTMHSPEIAEEIIGGSQYYIKMLTKLKQSKEVFGSEWMHRIDLPAPVNRPVSNIPDGLVGQKPEEIFALASDSFIPQGYSTVKDFLAGATKSTNIFNPEDLGQVVKAGIVEQRLSADVAQSVLGHMDLHTGNQLIDPATGKIGMLDFETILENTYPNSLAKIVEILKIQGVAPEVIAGSLQKGLQKITDIPPADIFDMMKRAKVPNPEKLLETYMARLDMTKKEIDDIISAKLFLADGGYIDKGKLRVPKFAKGGLIRGPGTGISDSISATLGYAGGGSIRVSNGEYVVKASSVRDYGVKTMDAINNGTATVGTNSGGTVYNINMPVTSNNANAEIVANEVVRKLKLEVSKNNKTNKVNL
jgi:hypothetical protein